MRHGRSRRKVPSNAGGLRAGQGRHEPASHDGVRLEQRLRRALRSDRADYLRRLGDVEAGQQMREISRIELIHSRRRDRQLDLVPPNGRQMKLVDGDDLVSQPPREPTQPEATQHRGDPHLDPCERQPALGGAREDDVGSPGQPATSQVDDLTVEDVSRKQQLVGVEAELARCRCLAVRLHHDDKAIIVIVEGDRPASPKRLLRGGPRGHSCSAAARYHDEVRPRVPR